MEIYKCECGREFTRPNALGYHKKFCGQKKISLDRGYEYYINSEGIRVYIHREVMEKKLGRKLKKGELTHHKDDNKRNNDPSNLTLKNRSSHAKCHYDNLSETEKADYAEHMRDLINKRWQNV